MALYDTTRPMTDRAAAHRPTGLFGQFVGMFTAWNDARITRNMLSNLTDKELDDVGLTRADIDRIARGARV